MTSLIFATTNQDKINEATSILNIDIQPLGLEIPEIQSLEPDQVAIQKAKDYFAQIKKPLFIEDVSLVFHSLKKLPGPYISDFSKSLGNDGLIDLLKEKEDRSATAQTTIVYINSDETITVFKGIVEGSISLTISGDNGFGWDPIFIPKGSDKTFAQMNLEEKNKYSMRRIALEQFANYLKG
jgi:XTP/dITP diphosphohydrolase